MVKAKSQAKQPAEHQFSSPNQFWTSWKSWTAERQAKIDALNERVTKLTHQAVTKQQQSTSTSTSTSKNKNNNDNKPTPLTLEYIHAQQPMTTLVAGAPVYQLRSAWVVYLYSFFAIALVGVGLSQIDYSVGIALLTLLTVFVGYDLYSGILHVVLDHPSNIALPVLGQPCLEFQWHHAIPDDLVRKDFVDVCGDLNVVIAILAVINLGLLKLDSGVSLLLGGFKLGMAYFGQFSHKSAHSFGQSRAPLAEFLQKNGFMISPKDHMAHHKPPHDVDFCLIGLCNPIIDGLRQLTTNNTVWLTLFLAWSIFDLVCYSWLVESISKLLGWM